MARRSFAMVIRAGIPGLLIAVALSREGLISVQIWIAAAAIWISATLLWDFIAVAAVEPDKRLVAWRPSRRRGQPRTIYRPVGMWEVKLLLANAQTNPRVHANALRPWLIALAGHNFAIRHGFDLESDPARVAGLLGDVAWLIDPAVSDRTPTSAEIGRFLDVILAEQDVSTSARQHEHRVVAK